MDRLEGLRKRIRRLDAALLALVSERMELAVEIGAAKRDAGIPLRDYAVEKHVLARAADTAVDLGLTPELSRSLTELLIEEACRLQEEQHFSGYSGDAETILVIGGAGQMGRWFARFFANQGHRVRVFDPVVEGAEFTVAKSLAAGLDGASLAVVATPLGRVAEDIGAVVDAGFSGTLWDIASLKSHLKPALERARERGVAVTSVHPMFGPGARTLSGRVVCVCDCGDAAATARVEGLFRDTAATLVRLSLDDHDRAAAYVLGLSHLVNLVFADTLAKSGLTRTDLEAVGSTTFQSQMRTTTSVVVNSPDLYYDIQHLNPYTGEVHRRLSQVLEDWVATIHAGDRDAFARAMVAGRAWTESPPEG
ncbi:MAG: bifunctional chorismate mutase/prephenate dehydrogenase [Acidobacteriota bacterium]